MTFKKITFTKNLLYQFEKL